MPTGTFARDADAGVCIQKPYTCCTLFTNVPNNYGLHRREYVVFMHARDASS